MSTKMTHRQRLEACLSGDTPDCLPIALWRHFPVADQNPNLLAKMTLDFQRQFDFDLIKVSPSSSYCLWDYGSRDEWRGNPEGTREYTNRVIQQPEDWLKLPLLDPKQGWLGSTLEALRLILAGNESKAPIIQTIFNPLSQAKNLAGRELLLYHMRAHPDQVKVGLDILTQNILLFLDEIRTLHLDGIFYAVQHAQYQLLNEVEFNTFSRPYDLKILNNLEGAWLNMVHLHGEHVMFDTLADYPVQIINWHDRETEVHLAEGQRKFPGVVCGGISRDTAMLLGTPEAVREEVLDAARATHGKKIIIGTGCVMMTTTPTVNIEAACRAAREYRY
jgi:uroporphyrinogen decarboxylase